MTGLRYSLWHLVALSTCFLSMGESLATAYTPEHPQPKGPLRDNRRPSLYTQDYGECQANPLIDITRFDGALYRDNMTVTFDLDGVTSETGYVMIYMEVYAYGETRFEFSFDPCESNLPSLCPINSSVPIVANGFIPISPKDLVDIPALAYKIPDFEGQTVLRVFSNSTQSQIACFSAALTNGVSFAHPAIVSTIFGIFTAIAVLSSLATAINGTDLPGARGHYAHSMSVFVVFSVFQNIYFTGALSMNWPSVLVAFWSNYAWSGGMIYITVMQDSISQFVGGHAKDLVGRVGSGFDISQLYRRDDGGLSSTWKKTKDILKNTNSSDQYPWHGSRARPGLPLPGSYSGFAGTLAQENIPISNAFLTGFLWFLVLLACVPLFIASIKLVIEGLMQVRMLRKYRFECFRTKWLQFIASTMLRTVYVGFFMVTFLVLLQFTLDGPAGATAIASIVLATFLSVMSLACGYALYCRLGRLTFSRDRLLLKMEKGPLGMRWLGICRENQHGRRTEVPIVVRLPWWRVDPTRDARLSSVHDDIDFLDKFGWLYTRFRRRRWYSFAIWLGYEFIRACFYGGASGHPRRQVFGILAVEIIALVAIAWIRPFEAIRLNALMVYVLGISKVASVALSAAFDPQFGLNRITTTVIGIVIIAIQGTLTIILLIAILTGAVSTYMSITRNKDVEEFKPRSWRPMRQKYLAHVERTGLDLHPPPPARSLESPGPKEPSFTVMTVRRYPKIEDEDNDSYQLCPPSQDSDISSTSEQTAPSGINRSASALSQATSSNLPFGARTVRPTWSLRELTLR